MGYSTSLPRAQSAAWATCARGDTMPNKLWRCAAVIASIALASTAEAQEWGSCGKAVIDYGTSSYTVGGVRTAPDGAGGALVVWNDNHSGTNKVYIQRIDPYGYKLWAPDGVSVGTGTNQTVPN